MDNEKNEYIFFWYIENYSYCWHKNGKKLLSPNFTVDTLEDTTWQLEMFPRGEERDNQGYISLFLYRSEEDNGPESISINYDLSILGADGSSCRFSDFDEFEKDYGCGEGNFLKTDEIFWRRKSNYLPQDTLTVCCNIWKGNGIVTNIGASSARTRIRVEKHSFLHVVENFSTIQPNTKHTIKIPSHSKRGRFIESSVWTVTTGGKIMIEIALSDTDRILCKCELSLIDSSGNIIDCGKIDNHYDASRTSIHTLPLSLTKDEVFNRKGEYLPNDKLSLICNCNFSSGIELRTIEETVSEMPLSVIKNQSNYISRKIAYQDTKKLPTYPSIMEDMKALYNNQCLTDVVLKTKTKSFPAHKSVLCARSPIFKAMMTNDMKEKNTDCIHVDDLKDDIMQQLLLFLYSDNIEDLQWNTATQLYYAADKYQIGKLKEVCSTFLLGNRTTTNAGDLLLLADTHSDGDLKKLVEDFILEHEEQVFGSEEWEVLMETNPLLVMKTMHLKYKRKK